MDVSRTLDAKPVRRTQRQVEPAHGEVHRQRLGARILENGRPQVGHDEQARRRRRAADQHPPHDLQEAGRSGSSLDSMMAESQY